MSVVSVVGEWKVYVLVVVCRRKSPLNKVQMVHHVCLID